MFLDSIHVLTSFAESVFELVLSIVLCTWNCPCLSNGSFPGRVFSRTRYRTKNQTHIGLLWVGPHQSMIQATHVNPWSALCHKKDTRRRGPRVPLNKWRLVYPASLKHPELTHKAANAGQWFQGVLFQQRPQGRNLGLSKDKPRKQPTLATLEIWSL